MKRKELADRQTDRQTVVTDVDEDVEVADRQADKDRQTHDIYKCHVEMGRQDKALDWKVG